MKKTLLTLFLAVIFTSICNGLTNSSLCYFKSDFRNSSAADPLGGWTCRGSGKTAQAVEIGNSGVMLNTIFPAGSPAFIPMDFEDFDMVYISNSTTEEGGAADEWLISPAIDLSDAPDNILLAFDVFAYGSSNDPKYEVYVSTTGCEPEDFVKPVYTGKGSNNVDYPVCERKYISLNGVSGSEVYLAFVNKSRNAQILGFKDVELLEYFLDVNNTTESFMVEPQEVKISLLVGAMTPVPCDGFTAVLSYEGESQTQVSMLPLGAGYVQTKVEFPTPLNISYGESINYTITINPNFEGSTPSVFNGSLACTEGYDPVCVMEEITATWCGWCIRGAVALNQFSEQYGDRFIGIAVHGSDDVMCNEDYLKPLLDQSKLVGYPNSWVNRTYSEDPHTQSLVEDILSKRVGYAVSIKGVTYDENGDNRMTVRYAPRVAFSTFGANMTAVVVVTEDNVTGTNPNYNQINYYSGATQMDIDGMFGSDAWPYFKEYAEYPDIIPFPLMKYNHVARGIFNSYLGGGTGAVLPSEWTADEEQEFSLSFELPMQSQYGDTGVQDWRNTHVVVLLLDNSNGRVLSAAKMGASDYTSSSVEEVRFQDTVSVSKEGAAIVVESDDAFDVSVYNMQGYCLYSSHNNGGVANIDAAGFSGPVVVRVSSGNDSYVKKLIF